MHCHNTYRARIDTGMRVLDTGGPLHIPLEIAAVDHVVSLIGPATTSAALLETGIKVIDLLAPLPRKGRIALVGNMQMGKMDAVITFSTGLAAHHLYPAIDLVHPSSRLLDEALVGKEHIKTATRVRNAFVSGTVEIAVRLQTFLVQPFFVAEGVTKCEGTNVPVKESIRDCRLLLDAANPR